MPTIDEKDSRIAKLETENRDLFSENGYLKRQIEALKRKLFGSPACERISDAQLTLALAELDQEQAEQAATEKEVIGYARRKPRSAEAVAKIPEDIETVTVEIVPEEVKADPEAYQRIGEETTKELDVVPMRFVQRVTVRPKFVKKADIDAVPFIAELPPRLIPGGIPAAGLVAQIIVWKYADHMPLYRLEKIFRERFGVSIPRQRMCDWIAYAVENWLSIIYRSIRNGLIGGDYLQIDETPIRYLDTERKGKSHKGYFWVFGRPEGDVCFDWSLGRGAKVAEGIVSKFEGLLQSDGYQVYDSACAGLPIVQLGCWAHARRKFYEAWKGGQSEAVRYLLSIRELYAVEASLPDDPIARSEGRKAKSLPVLEKIEDLLESECDRYPSKSGLAEAIGYSRNQWSKLTAYVDHSQARIDNNLTEQAIRPCKLGAKNWLFVGSPDAGKSSAVIYTILESCRRRGIEPMAYLSEALRRLPSMTNFEAEALAPKNWKNRKVNTG
ncbi:MAG: IS66 family transposase [Verrucomicrobiota bacterium]